MNWNLWNILKILINKKYDLSFNEVFIKILLFELKQASLSLGRTFIKLLLSKETTVKQYGRNQPQKTSTKNHQYTVFNQTHLCL